MPSLSSRNRFLSTPSARRATLPPGLHDGFRQDFYPRPPRGGRPSPGGKHSTGFVFLSTPSARRATASGQALTPVDLISIHALREEGDHSTPICICCCAYFYPRPPRGGRQRTSQQTAGESEFLSTPSARRATGTNDQQIQDYLISIHALREEGDSKNREIILCFCLIIHLPAQIAKRSL